MCTLTLIGTVMVWHKLMRYSVSMLSCLCTLQLICSMLQNAVVAAFVLCLTEHFGHNMTQVIMWVLT